MKGRALLRLAFTFINILALVAVSNAPALAEDAAAALANAATLLKAGRTTDAMAELDRVRAEPGLSPVMLFQLGVVVRPGAQVSHRN